MKEFDYRTLNKLVITPTMIKKISQISEYRGQISAGQLQANTAALTRLVAVAKIQSTDASNRIEGIYTSSTRLRLIMAKKTMPHDRSEAEISGYRDVLSLIHEQYAYIPMTASTILTLHKHLFSFTASSWGGKFKDIDNQIMARYTDGTEVIRFTPPAAYLTPALVESLCDNFREALQADTLPTLLLCGAFVFDFVSIHPFRDGNGRLSRLLMLLVLYQADYGVGRYISLEALIEKTKSQYYQALESSSEGWLQNTNDYQAFIDYFLSVVLQAYRDLAERLAPSVEPEKVTAPVLILQGLQNELRPLTKRELIALIPKYSQVSIERGLHQLVVAGKIRKVGAGRATSYVLVI